MRFPPRPGRARGEALIGWAWWGPSSSCGLSSPSTPSRFMDGHPSAGGGGGTRAERGGGEVGDLGLVVRASSGVGVVNVGC